MSTESIPVLALIEHREFVRELARRLLGDEHAAEDVVQDASMRALRGGAGSVVSPRAWFARLVARRASNERRERSRRTAREAAVARDEAVESASPVDLAEKLEVESRVVRAVLALREPYRAVVLGRYYEGLSTKELAARQGVTDSSVRSQEARALELLRRELDERFDGGRKAWSAALIGVVDPPQATAALASGAAWLGVIIACVGVGVWMLDAALEPRSHGRAPIELASTIDARGIGAGSQPEGELQQEPRDVRANVPAKDEFANVGPSLDELTAMPMPNLLQLGLQLQRELRHRMLTPDPALAAAALPANADASYGSCRLLERELYGQWSPNETLLGIGEGGSSYSFTARSHEWTDGAQIQFMAGELGVGGHGACIALGDVALGDVPARAQDAPPSWSAALRERWELVWQPAQAPDGGAAPEWSKRMRDAGLNRAEAKAVVGSTFLLRDLQEHRHDVVVAVRVVALGEESVDLAWRVLEQRPMAGIQGVWGARRNPLEMFATEPPAWIEALELRALRAVFDRVRVVGEGRLLAVPPEIAASAPANGGCLRLLDGATLGVLISSRGAGSGYAFARRAHDDRRGTDLTLENGTLQAGRWGDCAGILLDLGPVGLDAIDRDAPVAPRAFTPRERELWDSIWNLRSSDDSRSHKRALDRDALKRLWELQGHHATVAPGHAYLLRSVFPESHDLTLVLRVESADVHGVTLAWKILRELPAGERPR